jgi:hypothetical protein
MTSIVITNKQKILDQVEHGIELSVISKEMGITPSAICNQLASHEDYKQARVRGLETKLDNRERDLEQATDQLEVSRGRELLKLAQWKLERLHSTVYGNQPKLAINITTKTTEVLDDAIIELVSSQLEDKDG